MTSGNLSLSEAYRPRCFDEFIGKSELVDYLRRQISEETGRSVLLHGPAGCGKFSLASVYAAGLLCEASTNRPCRKCGSCSSLKYGRHLNLRAFEFGQIDDEKFANEINDDVRVETMGNGRFVVLINRANLLSARAFEFLHDQMKRSSVRVTFILCVDDVSALPDKTRTLFFPLEVKRPKYSDATNYLRLLRGESGIEIENDAIEALADLSRSSFQSLALDLEVLAERGRLAAADVVDYFLASPMAKYVDQVVNREDFREQMLTLNEWDVSPAEKIERIGSYLSDIFDLQFGLRPGSTRWSERFADLSDRLGMYFRSTGGKPRAFMTQMLRIWDQEPMAGPTTLRRKASEFDGLLTVAAMDVSQPVKIAHELRRTSRRTREYGVAEVAAKRKSVDPQPADREVDLSLSLSEARKLWDGASYMVQAYGVLLNAAITVRHVSSDAGLGTLPEHAITNFLRELRMLVARTRTDPAAELHTLYAHQTDKEGRVMTRIVGHIPGCRRDPKAWISSFFGRPSVSASLEGLDLSISSGKEAFAKHLSLIQRLCAGLMPCSPEHQIFLRRAKIDTRLIGWAVGAKSTTQRIGLSRLIDQAAQKKASDVLDVVYVFDQEGDPCSGWELAEYRYRQEIAEQRLQLEEAAASSVDSGLALSRVREEWARTKLTRQARRPHFHNSVLGHANRASAR